MVGQVLCKPSCKENIKIARYILFTPNSKEVKMAPNTTDKEIKR